MSRSASDFWRPAVEVTAPALSLPWKLGTAFAAAQGAQETRHEALLTKAIPYRRGRCRMRARCGSGSHAHVGDCPIGNLGPSFQGLLLGRLPQRKQTTCHRRPLLY